MNNMKVEKEIAQEQMDELGLKSWPIWEKEVSEFPWTYADQETCYIIEGKAEVIADDGQKVEFEKGDLVIFPKGLKCTWKISESIKKHYKFG